MRALPWGSLHGSEEGTRWGETVPTSGASELGSETLKESKLAIRAMRRHKQEHFLSRLNN